LSVDTTSTPSYGTKINRRPPPHENILGSTNTKNKKKNNREQFFSPKSLQKNLIIVAQKNFPRFKKKNQFFSNKKKLNPQSSDTSFQNKLGFKIESI
jgi:hypothetical protein